MKSHSAIALRRICLPLLLAGALSVHAETTVIQAPNVRTEYAQVLRVEPVYQTLRAYAVEERCDPPAEAGQPGRNCRPLRVEREYQRPIAYDVDYIHRGVKYRSRIPFDPGKRLRVKVSVTPDVDAAGKR
jgi:uncharacterized protein YcfJ